MLWTIVSGRVVVRTAVYSAYNIIVVDRHVVDRCIGVVVRIVVYSADNGRQVGWWAAAAAGAAWRPPASMKADCPAYYCTTPLYTTHHTTIAPQHTTPPTALHHTVHNPAHNCPAYCTIAATLYTPPHRCCYHTVHNSAHSHHTPH